MSSQSELSSDLVTSSSPSRQCISWIFDFGPAGQQDHQWGFIPLGTYLAVPKATSGQPQGLTVSCPPYEMNFAVAWQWSFIVIISRVVKICSSVLSKGLAFPIDIGILVAVVEEKLGDISLGREEMENVNSDWRLLGLCQWPRHPQLDRSHLPSWLYYDGKGSSCRCVASWQGILFFSFSCPLDDKNKASLV